MPSPGKQSGCVRLAGERRPPAVRFESAGEAGVGCLASAGTPGSLKSNLTRQPLSPQEKRETFPGQAGEGAVSVAVAPAAPHVSQSQRRRSICLNSSKSATTPLKNILP
ncbi:MAG: hypothetical protein KME26_11955 [Oscillatoria princeps RMCB-10]|nr:hypothetical protein [Oscillatoria princeps RMCB-10]